MVVMNGNRGRGRPSKEKKEQSAASLEREWIVRPNNRIKCSNQLSYPSINIKHGFDDSGPYSPEKNLIILVVDNIGGQSYWWSITLVVI